MIEQGKELFVELIDTDTVYVFDNEVKHPVPIHISEIKKVIL